MNEIPTEERHANGRKVRREALPENTLYEDEGCDLAPSCLSCPFVRCRHDYPDGIRGLWRAESIAIETVTREKEAKP